jgi:hypothetical protein
MSGLLAVLALLAVGDPMLMHKLGYKVNVGPQTAEQFFESALQFAGAQPRPDTQTLQR